MMLFELSVDFFHGLQADADHNQQRGTTERHLSILQTEWDHHQRRYKGDNHQVERTRRGNAVHDVTQEFSGRASSTVPHDET